MTKWEDLPAWKQRFLAPQISFPSWSDRRPDRLAAISTESGVAQVWAIDLATDERRMITDEPIGVTEAHMQPDCGAIVWWLDPTGDECGRWMVTPWEGGEARPLVEGLQDGWSTSLSLVDGAAAIGLAHDDDDYRVYLARDGVAPEVIYRHGEACGVGREWPDPGSGGLSADGALLCIRHSERKDPFAYALRVFDTSTGAAVAELDEVEVGFEPQIWAPHGHRLAVTHDRDDWRRVAIWEPRRGELRDLDPGRPGDAVVAGWWPDAAALLVLLEFEMRPALYRVDVATGGWEPLADPGGTIDDAGVRPDGSVWMRRSSSVEPARTTTLEGEELLRPQGPEAPHGRAVRTVFATNDAGDRIQGFVYTPDGDGPFPTILYSHGGPTGDEDSDRFHPEWQAYVDAGFAVVSANYRGSQGYGKRFRDAMRFTDEMGDRQTEDLLAVLDLAIAEGVADPDRLGFAGWSWGGYMGLYMAGVHPERDWKAIFSGVPAAELVSAHWESAPDLQAFDRSIMGGTPDDIPERFARVSPYTYVGNVRAPVMIVAGDNDSRCPIAQVLAWCEAFEAAGGDLTLYRFEAGHGSNVLEEDAKQVEMAVAFLRDRV